jgi:hypothetical protein
MADQRGWPIRSIGEGSGRIKKDGCNAPFFNPRGAFYGAGNRPVGI